MKLKKKKTVKGMTLVEIIVALFVFTIMGTLMARIGTVAKSMLMNSNHLNNKTQAESSIGSVKDKNTLDTYCGASGESNGEQPVTFTVGSYGSVTGNRYDTKAADSVSGKNCDTNLDTNASLQFYILN